jgi:hypothetical protein
LVHGRFLKFTLINSVVLVTSEGCRATNRFVQKVGNIDRAILSAKHPVWNTFTCDILTLVFGGVLVDIVLGAGSAVVKTAIERFLLIDPDCNLSVLERYCEKPTYIESRRLIWAHCR